MSKHQEDYSEKSVLNFLVMMKDIIQQGKNVPQTSIQIAEDQQQYQSRFSKAIQISKNKAQSTMIINYDSTSEYFNIIWQKKNDQWKIANVEEKS